MTSQLEQVHSTLVNDGAITSWYAIQKFRITRLSEYIRQLRSMGINIKSTWKQNKEGKRWVEYTYEKMSCLQENKNNLASAPSFS